MIYRYQNTFFTLPYTDETVNLSKSMSYYITYIIIYSIVARGFTVISRIKWRNVNSCVPPLPVWKRFLRWRDVIDNSKLLCTYQRKNGNQHNRNTPMMIPSVRAALCSVLQLVLVFPVGTKKKQTKNTVTTYEYNIMIIVYDFRTISGGEKNNTILFYFTDTTSCQEQLWKYILFRRLCVKITGVY